MSHDYITPAVKAIIGASTDWIEAPHPVQESEVRRFFQGTMDRHPRYWDTEWAAKSRYKAPVAPAAFVVHLFRRRPDDTSDPFEVMGDPDFDGTSRRMRIELPRVPIALPGVLNAGYAHEFYSCALIGERIVCRSRYSDIHQRDGKAGALVLVTIEDEYATTDGRPLLKSTNTHILR